jgi:hypothetical protein
VLMSENQSDCHRSVQQPNEAKWGGGGGVGAVHTSHVIGGRV